MSHNSDGTAAEYASTVRTPPREHAELLADERRRLAIEVLSGRTVFVELGELAAEIAALEERATPPTEGASRDVEIDLHHIHLPMLEEAGLLDYDSELQVVEPRAAVATADEVDDIWSAIAAGSSVPTDELRVHVDEYFDASPGETASLDDLSRYATTRLADPDDWPAERIRLRLHHEVLPELDAVGALDYDPRTAMVRCREGSL